jgi:hypothetical protein
MTKKEFVQTIKDLQEQSWGVFEMLVDKIEVEKDDRIEVSEDDYDELVESLIEGLGKKVKVVED